MKQRALTILRILWPAFMSAGVLEMLVFSAVDPADVEGLDRRAVYTIAFFVFWAVIATASSVTVWLLQGRWRD
jgi:hypothetical protein